MEKLELKHLAPYLPYDIKVRILNYKSDYVGKEFGTLSGYYYFNGEPHYYVNKDKNQAGKDWTLIQPILRPLSDLTKEIEVGGEKFVPSDKIMETHELWSSTFAYGFSIEQDSLGIIGFKTPESWLPLVNYIPFFDKLYEWHFDVFGLIEKGLAIDINTL